MDCGKYQIFLSENFNFLVVKFLVYLNRRVFVMFIPTNLVYRQNIGEQMMTLKRGSRGTRNTLRN